MSSLAGLTRPSFASGFADVEPPAVVGAEADTSGAGMVSIGSGLPAELVLAAAGAAAVSESLPSFETGTVGFGRGATWLTKLDAHEGAKNLTLTVSSCAGLGLELPLELAGEGESGRGTWEGESLEVTTFVGEGFLAEDTSFAGGGGKSFGMNRDSGQGSLQPGGTAERQMIID